MGVWKVPSDQQEKFGEMAATYSAVSHCYLRPTYPDWPYNIFTMVHATDINECDKILQTISQQSGVKDYMALYSSKEYKKVRVKYFTPEVAKWESENA
jgi:DNA-binding Lrp family transcriptional regulator